MSALPPPTLELWRGGVNTWECDEMGHLNVRFYVSRAIEGLAGVASALGLAGAFHPAAASTLRVRDQHIRFIREARPRGSLHMVGGLVEFGETTARVFQLLLHSATGEPAASFLTLIEHVTGREAWPFAWSRRTRERAGALIVEPPAGVGPRSLDLSPSRQTASLAEAERLGLIRLASGAVGATDCDAFGRARAEFFVGRISDGVPALGAALSRRAPASEADPKLGGAVLEYRIVHHHPLQAGDRFEIRSGLAGVGEKTQHLVHWVLDPDSGVAWASAQAVAVRLDLEARRVVGYGAEERARLLKAVTPGLAF